MSLGDLYNNNIFFLEGELKPERLFALRNGKRRRLLKKAGNLPAFAGYYREI
jgi:hypothetical protein